MFVLVHCDVCMIVRKALSHKTTFVWNRKCFQEESRNPGLLFSGAKLEVVLAIEHLVFHLDKEEERFFF